MLRTILCGAIALMATSAFAADAKDDVKAAAKKLGEAQNYSWTSTVKNEGGGGGGRGGGPTEGKAEKGGFTYLKMTRGENTIEAVLKADGQANKGAVKTQDGWASLAEAAEGEGMGRFLARQMQTFKAPAAQAEELAGKVKDLKKDGDAYVGELTEDGAKELLTFRRGADAPAPKNPKGSAKFWVKDGALAKYEFNVQGTVTFQDQDRDINRTTTVEIKDVGSTKVEVPEEGKAKAG
jgi:hypothetical protein